ncbi:MULTISPECIES: CDP-alcohol phosphatidyltransferase family protein [Rhodanobacter]|uniref:CDP-alcohol phosphatidyltransferase family protein n=1 Tax=Rhodanobacter TaxID=75309 RepID=UPI0004099BC9|nr:MULTISPECIES: CDP-alcohol phosphatidyltransferase family protein [Rhodanobacter]TAN16411.1 MAG: CDP-alcohol phosphatidyltransferase family protein [Rhodanobacter sp.]UJJ53157.1 CDP-alcohol phosphatidyltransferase family protein [Rhodanobacter thiooxydans]
MLDTRARHLVEPFIARVARGLKALGLSANAVTALAMLVGVVAALSIALDQPWLGIGLLWLSGLLDASDGALARMTHTSPLGAIMDITFDRVVEVAMIVALAWRHPEARFMLVILAGEIAVAMSLFLSIAAAIRNTSVKSFHYSPGLGERTEAFICLTLMVADRSHLLIWTGVFIAVIGYTMVQRLRHAARWLSLPS